MASYSHRVLILFKFSPTLSEIIILHNKSRKILRRISAKQFRSDKEIHSCGPFYKMFRDQERGIPYFMTYPKGHLQIKLFSLIKLRKAFDVSLTSLYTTPKHKSLEFRKWNYSNLSESDLHFNSEWRNEPYFHPPYIVNIHEETISVFKLEKGVMTLIWVLNFPCEFYEKTTMNRRLKFVHCGGFGIQKYENYINKGYLVFRGVLKGWGCLILDLEGCRAAVVKKLKEIFWIGGWEKEGRLRVFGLENGYGVVEIQGLDWIYAPHRAIKN